MALSMKCVYFCSEKLITTQCSYYSVIPLTDYTNVLIDSDEGLFEVIKDSLVLLVWSNVES